MNGWMLHGMGMHGSWMWLSWIVIAAAVVFVLWLAVRASWRYDPAEGEELLELLRRRYTSGAISEDEYFERLAILKSKLR